MKATLQLDPSLDILANRVPNAFLHQQHRRTRASTAPQAPRPSRSGGWRSALTGAARWPLFPEGGNWTPLRWRRAIDAAAHRRPARPGRTRGGDAQRPPARTAAGTRRASAACPAADVIFVAHAGLDRLVSVRDVWQSLSWPTSRYTARWWRVPADEVPRAAGHQAQVDWLYDWWQRIDAWISDQHARLPGSRDQDTYPERRAAGSPADALYPRPRQTRTPRFVRGGCDTAAMRTLSDSTDTRAGLPLTQAGLDAARHEVAWTLGDLPFHPGAASRSLWVVFLGAAGVWTHAGAAGRQRPGQARSRAHHALVRDRGYDLWSFRCPGDPAKKPWSCCAGPRPRRSARRTPTSSGWSARPRPRGKPRPGGST